MGNTETILEITSEAIEQLLDVDPKVCDHFSASLMGQSYKDIYQSALSDLLQEFCTRDAGDAEIKGSPFSQHFFRARRHSYSYSVFVFFTDHLRRRTCERNRGTPVSTHETDSCLHQEHMLLLKEDVLLHC